MQNRVSVVVNLKTTMDGSLTRKEIKLYLDFWPRLRLSWNICATFMDADCCSEDGPCGHHVGTLSFSIVSFFTRNFIDFIRDLITLFGQVERCGTAKGSLLIELFFLSLLSTKDILLFPRKQLRWKTIWKQRNHDIHFGNFRSRKMHFQYSDSFA